MSRLGGLSSEGLTYLEHLELDVLCYEGWKQAMALRHTYAVAPYVLSSRWRWYADHLSRLEGL